MVGVELFVAVAARTFLDHEPSEVPRKCFEHDRRAAEPSCVRPEVAPCERAIVPEPSRINAARASNPVRSPSIAAPSEVAVALILSTLPTYRYPWRLGSAGLLAKRDPNRSGRVIRCYPMAKQLVRCERGNGLRFGRFRRILKSPEASALGSGPGCPPFGGGAGFCDLRPQFDHLVDNRFDRCQPTAARTECPGKSVGEPEHRFMQSDSMVVHQCGFGDPGLRDCALVVRIVLAALDSQARHIAILQLFDERCDAGVPGSEFAHAMLSMANHADNPHWHSDEHVQELTAGGVAFLMEVDSSPFGHKVGGRTANGRKVLRFDEHATHEIPLAPARLVDERIGGPELPTSHVGLSRRTSARPVAMGWSVLARAWA